ncbi:MAG: hypothetical protein N2255_06155 [Kiritimatiellae bacterium]|nr:hypothetical protein [Kiritimatiellia bacterium]
MKAVRLFRGGMVFLVLVAIAGCRSVPTVPQKTPYELLQEKATAINEAGGLAAVGVGVSSQSVSLALEKAKARARTELAYIIEGKIEALKKSFAKEVGEAQAPEYNQLFTAASRNVAQKILAGAPPEELKHETVGGTTTAWALLVQNPRIILDAFTAETAGQKEQYARLRSSRTWKEFEDRLLKYEQGQQGQPRTTGERAEGKGK